MFKTFKRSLFGLLFFSLLAMPFLAKPAQVSAATSQSSAYSWQFISQTASKSLVGLSPGETVTLTLTAKNTGTTTWLQAGSNPVRVGTTNPRDRVSAFANGSWLSTNRPVGLPTASVAPNTNVTFTWTYTAPARAGTYRENFSLVAEGATWMNDPGVNYYTVVNGNYSWEFKGQTANTDLTNLVSGQEATITLTAKNTGNTIWYRSSSNPVHVGTTNPRDRVSAFANDSWLSTNRPVGLPTASVAPGDTVIFTWTYTAPATAGTYRENFSLVAEGITWMNDPGVNYYTVVAAAPTPITAIGAITGTPQVGAVLTAGGLTPAGATATYQWQIADEVDGAYTNIGGATSSTYTVLAGNVGKFIKVVATGTGGYTGTATSAATSVVAPAPLTAIGAITGTPQIGEELTAGALTPDGATATYQWRISDTEVGGYANIVGATSSTYTVASSYVDKYIKVVATGTGSYTGSVTSAAVLINKKQLTITNPTLTLSKPYDGNTTAAVTAGTLSGIVGSEDVTVTAVANYDNAAVGTGKTITVVYTLGGADAAKYVKPVNYIVATGVITDITAPELTAVAHNEGEKTITYTYSEPVHFETEHGNVVTPVSPAILNIFVAPGDTYDLGTIAPGVTITGATFNGNSTVLTVTYTGSLVNGTEYRVDSWVADVLPGDGGYDIKDASGNTDTDGVSAVFIADLVAPQLASVAHNEGEKTITYTLTEPVQFINKDTGGVVAEADIPAILNIFVVTGVDFDFGLDTIAPNATITVADFNADSTVLTLTYTGNLVNMTATDYIVNPWTGTGNWAIRDLAGNDMVDNGNSLFTVADTDTTRVISGVTAPVVGVAPVSAVTATDQYTGTVTWSPTVATNFVGGTVYTATIILTPKTGYTMTGVPADFFTVAGSTFRTNLANSGTVTAVFPATGL